MTTAISKQKKKKTGKQKEASPMEKGAEEEPSPVTHHSHGSVSGQVCVWGVRVGGVGGVEVFVRRTYHTYTCIYQRIAQHGTASVGLAQARPNYAHSCFTHALTYAHKHTHTVTV